MLSFGVSSTDVVFIEVVKVIKSPSFTYGESILEFRFKVTSIFLDSNGFRLLKFHNNVLVAWLKIFGFA